MAVASCPYPGTHAEAEYGARRPTAPDTESVEQIVFAFHEKSVTSEHRNVDDALYMTGIAYLFEVVAGIIAHSSALLSDAGHMQTMMLHPISLSNEGGG
jgi:hypothetical protein